MSHFFGYLTILDNVEKQLRKEVLLEQDQLAKEEKTYLDSLFILNFADIDSNLNDPLVMDSLWATYIKMPFVSRDQVSKKQPLKNKNKVASYIDPVDVYACGIPEDVALFGNPAAWGGPIGGEDDVDLFGISCQARALKHLADLYRAMSNVRNSSAPECRSLSISMRGAISSYYACSGSGGPGPGGPEDGGFVTDPIDPGTNPPSSGTSIVVVAPVVTINLQERLKCFNSVPNNASTKYKVTLHVDKSAYNQAIGHAFITLEKSNGNQVRRISYGLYPNTGNALIIGISMPIIGAIGDESGDPERESDVRYTLDVNEAIFKNVMTASVPSLLIYDLNDYNCTNYAIEMFNLVLPVHQKLIDTSWPNTLASELESKTNNSNIVKNKIKVQRDHPNINCN